MKTPAQRPTRCKQPGVAPAEARLVPYLVAVPWAAALAALVATFVSPNVVQTYALYPLLLGTVVLGLPHGALDHLLPARLNLSWRHKPLAVGGYLALYVALAAAFFALWLSAPRVAFSCFLLLTVAHWGHGDLRFTGRFWGRLDQRLREPGRRLWCGARCPSPCR